MALEERKTNPPVRLSKEGRRKLDRLAATEKLSLTVLIDKALEAYEEKKFWEAMNAGYAAQSSNVSEYDGALMDGLDPDERWDEA